jgi:hypothetical protein
VFSELRHGGRLPEFRFQQRTDEIQRLGRTPPGVEKGELVGDLEAQMR